jgi:hypothetical protein
LRVRRQNNHKTAVGGLRSINEFLRDIVLDHFHFAVRLENWETYRLFRNKVCW